MITIIAAILLFVLLLTVILVRKKRKKNLRKLKTKPFVMSWRKLQKHCSDRSNWPFALAEADALLDKALIKQRFKGKTMGARLMAAQREITDNDAVWVAHNLAKKIRETLNTDKEIKLTKTQVLATLKTFRSALLDLKALKQAENEAKDESR